MHVLRSAACRTMTLAAGVNSYMTAEVNDERR